MGLLFQFRPDPLVFEHFHSRPVIGISFVVGWSHDLASLRIKLFQHRDGLFWILPDEGAASAGGRNGVRTSLEMSFKRIEILKVFPVSLALQFLQLIFQVLRRGELNAGLAVGVKYIKGCHGITIRNSMEKYKYSIFDLSRRLGLANEMAI